MRNMKGFGLQRTTYVRAVMVVAVLAAALVFTGCPFIDVFLGPGTEEDDVLEAPQNVSASGDNAASTITVTWNGVVDADRYVLEWERDGGFAPTRETVNGTSYTLNAVQTGYQYYFTVWAVASDGTAGDKSGRVMETVSAPATQSTLTVDVKASYFTNLGVSSLNVRINGSNVGTIDEVDVPTTGWYQDSFSYSGSLSSVAFEAGSYSNTFDELSDFASDSAPVAGIGEIKKVVLYPYYNLFSDAYTGTGAYVGPKKLSSTDFTVGSETASSLTVTLNTGNIDENTSGMTFDLYESTTGETASLSADLAFYTLVASDLSVTELESGHEVTGLNANTTYYYALVGSHEGVDGLPSLPNDATTLDDAGGDTGDLNGTIY